MANEADILKEFLVSLGFKIDKGSERQFTDTLAAATVHAVQLGAAVTATAAAVVAGVAKIADNLESLYFASERTKASADNIQAYAFGVRQLGGSADGATGSLENLARLLRNSPGGEGLLKNIGIQTRDANGQLRDSVDMLEELGKKFAGMPFYKANAYAQALGIDERTLMALRQGVGEFGQEYKAMLKAAGLDVQDAAKGSHEFMMQLRLLGGAVTVLVQKIGSLMTGKLTESMRHLRETFVANFARITDGIVGVLGFVFKLADAVTILALRGAGALGRLFDWFNNLSEGSKSIIKWLGLILVAWKVLNAGFLSSPIGRVLALATAVALLWDDYQVWKEGGKSLIDWSAWAPGIEAAIKAIQTLGEWIHSALSFTGDWRPALELLLAYVAGSWLLGMVGAIGKVGAAFATVGKSLLMSMTGLLGNVALVGAAGALGYALGTAIYNKLIDGTDFGKAIGRMIAKTLAFFGNKEAAAAVATEEKAKAVPTPAVTPGAVPTAAPAPVPTIKATTAPAPVPLQATTAPSPKLWGKERGLRNNNPGNIEYGAFAKRQGATGAEDVGRFAVFKDAQEGLNALAELLRSYAGRGIDSVRKIIAKYAPAGENNTEAYVASVSKRLGVNPDQKLNLRTDSAQLSGMIDAVVRVENGRNPYGKEMLARAAGAPAGKSAEVNQTVQITVTGTGDPKAVAQDVVRAQNNVNEQLVRNMRGAILQ